MRAEGTNDEGQRLRIVSMNAERRTPFSPSSHSVRRTASAGSATKALAENAASENRRKGTGGRRSLSATNRRGRDSTPPAPRSGKGDKSETKKLHGKITGRA